MIAALKGQVVPVLRQKGFTGSFPHFRRRLPDAVHLITFQFNKHGGSFVVELATCPPDGYVTSWGARVPAAKVTAWDVVRPRRRLGGPDINADGIWFNFEKRGLLRSGDRFERAAAQMLPYLESDAEVWWGEASR